MKKIMSRRFFGAAVLLTSASAVGRRVFAAPANRLIQVQRNPGCSCCEQWVLLMEQAGFDVNMQDHENLDAYRSGLGVPSSLAGCHTGIVDGYIVEGHVPLQDVVKLITERPDSLGIAVPGMPLGSPGMEAGGQKEPFDVVLFKKDGTRTIFNTYV